jgi:hypothetical protein
MEDWHST